MHESGYSSSSSWGTLGRLSRAFVTVVCALSLVGCGYTYHFKDRTLERGQEHNEWASFFVFGIVGHYELDTREFCPNGVHEITTGNNFLTWLVGAVTIGIYTPRKVNIWCGAKDQSAAFEVGFAADGRPTSVTKQVGGARSSGDVSALGGGRYGVSLRTSREQGAN